MLFTNYLQTQWIFYLLGSEWPFNDFNLIHLLKAFPNAIIAYSCAALYKISADVAIVHHMVSLQKMSFLFCVLFLFPKFILLDLQIVNFALPRSAVSALAELFSRLLNFA